MDPINDPLALGPSFLLPWLLFGGWLVGSLVLVAALAALIARQSQAATIEDPVVTETDPKHH